MVPFTPLHPSDGPWWAEGRSGTPLGIMTASYDPLCDNHMGTSMGWTAQKGSVTEQHLLYPALIITPQPNCPLASTGRNMF